jgi:hypothetical protein
MNERVKILWAKAAESNFGDSWEEQTAFMSKFAQLIVKECADIANAGIDPAESHLIGDDILKHFGVEE